MGGNKIIFQGATSFSLQEMAMNFHPKIKGIARESSSLLIKDTNSFLLWVLLTSAFKAMVKDFTNIIFVLEI